MATVYYITAVNPVDQAAYQREVAAATKQQLPNIITMPRRHDLAKFSTAKDAASHAAKCTWSDVQVEMRTE